MVIMDEASQCNTAMSLVPIIRGNNLMLVGDPQQLNPVVLLDKSINEILRKKYNVSPEYDYIANSVYKTFLACDSVSDEILLSYHYRCDKKIIEFNNKKYYNGRLKIKTNIDEQHVDLPSTEKLLELYNFEVICDNDLNFKDNTVAGDIFLNPKLKFTPNRGSWFNIPLSVLKK